MTPFKRPSENGLYTLRMHDSFDHGWIDCTGFVSKPWDECLAEWNRETSNGTRLTQYSDREYYAIFPANTTMVYQANDD